MDNIPKVGIGVMVRKDGKFLMVKRKGSHADGEYASPGGTLEYMESLADCAKREIMEECGIEIDNVRFQYIADMKKFKPKHYVEVGFVADWKSGEPKVMEPHKAEKIEWFDFDHLPENIMASTRLLIESVKTGKNYFPDVE